ANLTQSRRATRWICAFLRRHASSRPGVLSAPANGHRTTRTFFRTARGFSGRGALGTHVGQLRRHPISAHERAWLFGLLSLPTSLYLLLQPARRSRACRVCRASAG